MKKTLVHSSYVCRDPATRDSVRRKVMDMAGELQFWGTEPVFVMEVEPEGTRRDGKLLGTARVTDVHDQTKAYGESADLQALVDDTIAYASGGKPCKVVKYTNKYVLVGFSGQPVKEPNPWTTSPRLVGWLIEAYKVDPAD